MILSDREIRAALDNNLIRIYPEPPEDLWTSTAIDLTLNGVLLAWDPKTPSSGAEEIRFYPKRPGFNIKSLMDDSSFARKVPLDAEDGFVLRTGDFYLGYTRERIYLPHRSRLAARVEGKSSLARLGVGIHVTAPTIHAGFGWARDVDESKMGSPIQLEIFHFGRIPAVLETGMAICQLILEEVREAPVKGYQGQFTDQTAFATEDAGAPPVPQKPKE